MSLRDLLEDVADANPVPRPAGLYDRARRAQLRRRLLAGSAALVAIVSLGLPLLRPPVPAQPAAPGALVRLPRHVQAAPAWTADVRRAPIDRAIVAFTQSTSDTLTLVGPDDQYRTYVAKLYWLLSPDGRYLMNSDGSKTELLRLGDGSRRTLALGRPLAWSPDSTQAVFATFAGDPDATKAVSTELAIVSMPEASVLWRATLPPTPRPGFALAAALAPDNSAVAVQLADQLSVYGSSGLRWKRQVATLQELAGPFAWCPSGTGITLTRPGPDAAFAVVDAATGERAKDIQDGGYLTTVGGQGKLGGMPAVVGWRDNVPQVNAGNKALVSLPHDVLMTAAEGTYEMQVATDGLSWRTEEPGPPDPGPALQRYRGIIAAAGGLTLLALVLGAGLRAALERRSRARSRRRTGPA